MHPRRWRGKHDVFAQVAGLSMFALALAVAMLIMRKLGKRTTVDQYLNAIGNVALIMFVTLMLTVLLPFRCLPNPNGTKAMASIPNLLCWQVWKSFDTF